MKFPILYYVAAFAGAFVTALAGLPLWRRWCLRTGLVDDPGHRKIHDEPIPLAGGLTVMTGMVVPILVALLINTFTRPDTIPQNPTIQSASPAMLLSYGLNRRSLQLAAIFIGSFGMLVVGLLDDKHELRPAAKFTGQFVVALLVAATGIRITLFVPSVAFSYAVTILWILTVINAFNFMDNMNGLCGGLGAIGAFYFALLSALAGQYLVALIGFLACGALVGFLPYNFPRARSFLGDAGSHLVGFLLAVLAILPHFYSEEHPYTWAVFSPLLVLAIPLGDLVWVVILRWRLGKPFYIGDNNHLSHRLVRAGFSRAQAVLLIWLVAAAIGAFAFL